MAPLHLGGYEKSKKQHLCLDRKTTKYKKKLLFRNQYWNRGIQIDIALKHLEWYTALRSPKHGASCVMACAVALCPAPVFLPAARLQDPQDPRCLDGSCNPPLGDLMVGRGSQLSTSSTCGQHGPQNYCIIGYLEVSAEDANTTLAQHTTSWRDAVKYDTMWR